MPDTTQLPLGQHHATQPIQLVWLGRAAPQSPVDAASLRQVGVALACFGSVEALALGLEGRAPIGLLVADLDLATSPALRAWATGRGAASLHAMPILTVADVADVATEVQLHACIRAGVVDIVVRPFALTHLLALGQRARDAQAQAQRDGPLTIAAIDSQRAMAHMQADAAFFGSLLRAFLDELPHRKKQLQDDWSRSPQQIKHHSHALKGLAMTLGLHHLAEVAARVEALAAHGAVLDAALLLELEAEMVSAGFQILRWLQVHAAVVEATP
jgi:HPt (histidine-containing phosphotransfer) domain-containing protein